MLHSEFSNFVKNFPLYYSLKDKYKGTVITIDNEQFKNAMSIIYKSTIGVQMLTLICLHYNMETQLNINIYNTDQYDDLLKQIIIDYSKML